MEKILEEKICPICGEEVTKSHYLEEIFRDSPKVNYLAHMVTHYRHNHITSWNKCWGQGGHYYRRNWFGDYEEEKKKVNERAKRQIIRKGKDVLRQLSIKSSDFLQLQNTEPKTLELAVKILD